MCRKSAPKPMLAAPRATSSNQIPVPLLEPPVGGKLTGGMGVGDTGVGETVMVVTLGTIVSVSGVLVGC